MPRSTRPRTTAGSGRTTSSTVSWPPAPVQVTCREVGGTMRARARVVLAGWLPGHPDLDDGARGRGGHGAAAVTREAEAGFVATELAFGRRAARAAGGAPGAHASRAGRNARRPRASSVGRWRAVPLGTACAIGARRATLGRHDGAQPRRRARATCASTSRAPTAPSSHRAATSRRRVTVRDARGAGTRARRGGRVVVDRPHREPVDRYAAAEAPMRPAVTTDVERARSRSGCSACACCCSRSAASRSTSGAGSRPGRSLANTADAAALAGASAIDEDAYRHTRRGAARSRARARAEPGRTSRVSSTPARCARCRRPRRPRRGDGRRCTARSGSRCSGSSDPTATSRCGSTATATPRRAG